MWTDLVLSAYFFGLFSKEAKLLEKKIQKMTEFSVKIFK